MKKNVLGGLLGSQHTKIHLSGLKAQYKAKMELLPDGGVFSHFRSPAAGLLAFILKSGMTHDQKSSFRAGGHVLARTCV